MNEDESLKVRAAIRDHGAIRVAKVLDVSREAVMSLSCNTARAGTVAVARPNLSKLDELK